MKSIWDASARENIEQRLARLKPDTPPRWGKFTAPQMVCHLSEAVRMAIGDLPVKPRKTPFKHFPLKQIIIYVVPLPRSAPTAPELLAGAPQEWNGEVQRFRDLLRKFAGDSHHRFSDHPAFGKLSRRGWGVLGYKHIDHHLRQFGV